MIFHDKPNQQLCDDDKLIAVLNDGDQTAEHQEVIEHIEQCSRCQQRFDELAAGAQDWTKVRQALLNDDPCSENRVGSAKWDYSLRNEGPVAWTESMASQLLSPASHPELLGRLGRYDVERLIGSGGMGVVFKAHDSELNRPVAIKILAPYLSSSGPARKRFAREARAAAAVVHEHVVPIYNVETEREIPFLVMHYIAGESLQSRIDREGALELCEILRIGMQVASGLSAAHQQGLVHRDIKPSNILMEQGVERALITDFGLARAADDASLTRTGFHPGTPQYMSPEQAAGEQVDARSDLFSLGSVLYTMCTGRPPFRAETSLGVLRRITDVEPRPIREINPNIPEWLCSLIARLMSKSPEDRFANALEVADLLGQCLAHVQQPVVMPLPVGVQALAAPAQLTIGETSKPNRLKAGHQRVPPFGKFIAAAAFAMALVFAGVFIVLELNKGTLTIQTEADDIRVRITQGDEVIDELKVTKSGQSVRVAAGQYKVEILGKTDELTVDNELVRLHRSGNEVVRIIRKAANYPTGNQTTSKNLSADQWRDKLQGNWNVVQQYVDDGVPKRHSSSATVLRNRMEVIPTDGQDSMMFDLVFGEEGPPQQIDLKPVLSDVERQELLQGWSSDNDEPLPEDLVNPIFHGIIELDSNGFRICNHMNPCSPRPIQFTDSSERVIWSFSKSELDESAEVRGTVDSEQPNSRSEWKIKQVFNPAHDQMVWAVAFNPDGKTIASAGADKKIKFWDVASGSLRSTLFRPVNCTDVAFSPDGTYLAIAGGDDGENPPGELVLIEAAKGEEGFALKDEFVLESHETALYSKSVAFSSDSKWLASGGSDKRVKIWSVEQRNLHIELTGHTELVSQVAFSPNGKILASASFDHTVKLWSVPDGKAIATLRGHDKEVRGVAFSPDSNLLVSVSEDGTARLWNTGSGEPLGVMDGHGGPMFSVAFAPDGRHFVTGSRGQSGVMIWDKNTQKGFIPEVSPQQAREIMSLTFSADGRMLAIAGGWNGFHIWDRKAVMTEQVRSSYLPERNASDAHLAAAEKEYQQLQMAEGDLRAAYDNAIEKAKSDEDRERAEKQFDARDAYTPKYLAFEERYRGTPAGLNALIKVVGYARSTLDPNSPAPVGRIEAVDRLIGHYVAFDGIEQTFDDFRGGLPVPRERELLKAVFESNPSRYVRAEAMIAQFKLNRKLLGRHESLPFPPPPEWYPESWRSIYLAFQRVVESVKPDELRNEQQVIIEQLRRQEGLAVSVYGRADAAAEHLSNINHIIYGKRSPEIAAITSTGKSFRLSGMRGKTVLLVFAHDEGADNNLMYAPLRKLATDYKSKNVEVVMILTSYDSNHRSAAALKRDFPWTVIQQPSSGPLLLDWNVQGFPAVHLIDAKGILRSSPFMTQYDDKSGYDTTEVAAELDKILGAKQSHNNDVSKGQSGTDVEKPLYADLQGDWIIDSLYIDEDSNSREWQKQAGGPVFIGAIKVTANELYFRNLPSAGMTRTSAAIALEPVEGSDPRLFKVVDSQDNFRFGMYKVDGDKLTILLTQEAQPKLLAPTEGEYYIECHRPVSTEEKAVRYAIDKLNPDQIKVIDGKPKDTEQTSQPPVASDINDKRLGLSPETEKHPMESSAGHKSCPFCEIESKTIRQEIQASETWSGELPGSEELNAYIAAIRAFPDSSTERFKFYWNHLENKNEKIADDSSKEIELVLHEHWIANVTSFNIKELVNRQKLVGWIKNPEVPHKRKQVYLGLLGICGESDDIDMLKQMIEDRANPILMEAQIIAYVSLGGPAAWDFVEQKFLQDDLSIPGTSIYSMIRAVRFLDTHSNVIARDRLLQSLHLMLDRPSLADLVVKELIRMEDWSQVGTLVDLLKSVDENSKWVRLPIVQYLQACPLPEAADELKKLREIAKALDRSRQQKK